MKKFILLTLCLYATVQISLAFDPVFRREYQPTYQPIDKVRSNYQLPTTKLQPQSNDRIQYQLRDFRQDPQGSPRYNSNCQFGMCIPGGPGSSFMNNDSQR